MEVAQIIAQERVQNRTGKQIVGVVHSIPMEVANAQMVEQIIDVQKPHVMEKIVKVPKITQQDEDTQYRQSAVRENLKTGSSSEPVNKLRTHVSSQP